MIVFAALTPHSPLLLESIGKENSEKLSETTNAFKKLADELYVAKPDTVVFLSTHSEAYEDTFTINLHNEYSTDFKDFGDLSTHKEFVPDVELVAQIRQKMLEEHVAVTIDSHKQLNYNIGVPLTLLAKYQHPFRLLPIAYCRLDVKSHVQFGRILKDVFSHTNKRIAIIASGDLSHALSSDAPAGYKPEGEAFDQTILQALQNNAFSQILSMDPKIVSNAVECAYHPLLILCGILEKMQIQPEIFSYEHPFGVGEMVVQFHLNT